MLPVPFPPLVQGPSFTLVPATTTSGCHPLGPRPLLRDVEIPAWLVVKNKYDANSPRDGWNFDGDSLTIEKKKKKA